MPIVAGGILLGLIVWAFGCDKSSTPSGEDSSSNPIPEPMPADPSRPEPPFLRANPLPVGEDCSPLVVPY